MERTIRTLLVVCTVALILVSSSKPAWWHNGGDSNANIDGLFELTAKADLINPSHGSTFTTTQQIDFDTTSLRGVLKNNASGSVTYTYSREFNLGEGGSVLQPHQLNNISWAASGGQALDLTYDQCHSWPSTASGAYYAFSEASLWTPNNVYAYAYHTHDFTVQ